MDGNDFINAVRWPTCRVLAFSQAILLLSAPTRYPACCADNSSFCLLSLPVCHQQVPCPSDLRQMAKKKDFLIDICHDITGGCRVMQVSGAQPIWGGMHIS